MLWSGVAEATDSLGACRSSPSLLDVCCMSMPSGCRFCHISDPLLMSLFLTAAVSRGNCSSGDDGSSQGVLVAMGFEQVTYSDAS